MAKAAAAAWGNQANDQQKELDRMNQERREKAVKWVDKEVRKLISVLQKMGRQVNFGALFKECANDFEALSGTLVAAKKKGAVNFEGAMLLMGTHDDTVIYLLKDEIPDTPLPKPMADRPAPRLNVKSKGFDSEVMGVNEKCYTCGKTVYPTERLAAASKVFHEPCFVCCQCKGKLRPADFCSVNGKFYCKPHYTFLFNSKGGYDAMDGGGGKKYGGGGGGASAPSPAPQSPPPEPVQPPAPKPTPAPAPKPAPVQREPEPVQPPPQPVSPRKVPAPAPAPAPVQSPPSRRPSPPQPRQPDPEPEKDAAPERERGGLPFAVPKLRSAGGGGAAGRSAASSVSSQGSSADRENDGNKLPFQAPSLRSVGNKKPSDMPSSSPSSPSPSSPPPAEPKKTFFSAPKATKPPEPKPEPKRAASPPRRAPSPPKRVPSPPPPEPEPDPPAPPPEEPAPEKKKGGWGGFAAALGSLGFGKDKDKDSSPDSETPPPPTRSPRESDAPPPPPPDSRSSSVSSPPPSFSRAASTPAVPPRPAFKKEPVSPRAAAPALPQRPPKKAAPESPPAPEPRSLSPGRGAAPGKKAPPPPRSAGPVEYKAPPEPEPAAGGGSGGGSIDISAVGKKYLVPARMILYLRENGTYETDIFRTCFEPDEIKALCDIMYTAKGATVELSNYSVSTIAFCLKRWLRDSDQPLFPYKFFNALLDIQKSSDGYGKMVRIAEVVMALPNENRIMLALLFDLLLEVAQNVSNTSMSADKLAYTFGPCILRPKDLPSDMRQAMDEAKKINNLLTELVGHSNEVFENVIIPEMGDDVSAPAAPPPAPAASSYGARSPPAKPSASPASGGYSKAAPSAPVPTPAASSSSPRLPTRPTPSPASPSGPSSPGSGSYGRALPPPPRKTAGEPLGRFCTSCGTKNTGKFCTQCGASVTG